MFGVIKCTPGNLHIYYYQLTKSWQSTEETCDPILQILIHVGRAAQLSGLSEFTANTHVH